MRLFLGYYAHNDMLIFSGCNVIHIKYPQKNTAERNVIISAVSLFVYKVLDKLHFLPDDDYMES